MVGWDESMEKDMGRGFLNWEKARRGDRRERVLLRAAISTQIRALVTLPDDDSDNLTAERHVDNDGTVRSSGVMLVR